MYWLSGLLSKHAVLLPLLCLLCPSNIILPLSENAYFIDEPGCERKRNLVKNKITQQVGGTEGPYYNPLLTSVLLVTVAKGIFL